MANERGREEILEELRQVFRSVLGPEAPSIDESSDMASVPGWDSLSHLALVSAVEARFELRLTLAELRRLDSVKALVDLLAARGI